MISGTGAGGFQKDRALPEVNMRTGTGFHISAADQKYRFSETGLVTGTLERENRSARYISQVGSFLWMA